MKSYTLKREQIFPCELNTVWEFIISPRNLSKITPDEMGFIITTKNLANKIYPGLMISYKIKPLLQIPVTWVTEITQVEENKFFVDEQREGPYKMWHHEHHLEKITLKDKKQGTKMTDLVTYIPPFGPVGDILVKLVIKKKLEEIFDFRKKKLEEMWGKYDGGYE